jgi:hypothetical protein
MVGALSLIGAVTSSPSHGRLRVVTYNVAGLPDGFMTPHPSSNMPLIGRLLGTYDLALVQEDFMYPDALRKNLHLAYQSAPFVRGQNPHLGDGLSQFSCFPFSPLQREPWRTCHGVLDSYFDCLTPKGFSWTRQTLTAGVELDVYNVHLDAGWGQADFAAREAQVEQLIAAIAKRSAGRAVLLAGDTNIPRHQRSLLERLERSAGLVDVCGALRCSEPNRIDRVLYRSSSALRLAPKRWRVDRRFVDAKQRPLSDHLAVAVEFDWDASAPQNRSS